MAKHKTAVTSLLIHWRYMYHSRALSHQTCNVTLDNSGSPLTFQPWQVWAINTLLAQRKTTVSPLLTHWRYHSLVLSHRYMFLSFNYGPTATPGPTYGQPAWGQPSLPPSNTQTPSPGPSHWGNRTYSGNTGPQLPAKFSQGLPNIPPAPYPGLQNNNQQNAGFRNTISQNVSAA